MDQDSEKQVVQKNWQDKAYLSAARNKSTVLLITNVLYIALIGIIIATTYSIYNDQEFYNFFAKNRAWFGRIGLLVLLIVITPGILGRFNIQIKVTRIITLYRRRLGILVFLLGFTHAHIVSLPKVAGTEPNILPLFQRIGITALMILFVMFLTSNNFSVRKLGKWWKRIHRLIYVVVLLILIHTLMQRVSIWSVLAGIFFVLEISSLAYAFIKGGGFNNPALKTPKQVNKRL